MAEEDLRAPARAADASGPVPPAWIEPLYECVRTRPVLLFGLVTVCVTAVFVVVRLLTVATHHPMRLLLVAVVLGAMSMWSRVMLRWDHSPMEGARREELAVCYEMAMERDDPRVIPMLALAFLGGWVDSEERLKPKLIELLGRLQPSDMEWLTAHGLAQLIRLLQCDDLDVLLAALEAIGRLAPPGVRGAVRRLAARPPHNVADAAAMRRWRTRRERAPGSALDRLLSAAEQCDALLAAAGGGASPRNRLLRAVKTPVLTLPRAVNTEPVREQQARWWEGESHARAEELLTAMRAATHRYRSVERYVRGAWVVFPVLFALSSVVCICIGVTPRLLMNGLFPLALLTAAALPLHDKAVGKLRALARRACAGLVAAVPPAVAARAAAEAEPDLARILKEPVEAFLRRLSPEDVARMDADGLYTLIRLATGTGIDGGPAIRLIKPFYERTFQVLDRHGVQQVMSWEKMAELLPAEAVAEISPFAPLLMECLSEMRGRSLVRASEPETLLRPAPAGETREEALARPAEEPAQVVRPDLRR